MMLYRSVLKIKIVQYNLQCLCKDSRSKVGRIYPPKCICYFLLIRFEKLLILFLLILLMLFDKNLSFYNQHIYGYLFTQAAFSVIMIFWRSKLFCCKHAITNYSRYFEIVSPKNAVKQCLIIIVNLKIETSSHEN